jgi:hypothetical protein
MSFTESNTVEQMMIDAACSLHQPSSQPFSQRAKGFKVREDSPAVWRRFFGRRFGMAKSLELY